MAPDAVRELQTVCRNHNAVKGILVSVAGFTEAPRSEAGVADPGPPIELVDLDVLADLVWRHLDRMPDTKAKFLAWCGSGRSKQTTMHLGGTSRKCQRPADAS
jgi:hypothetical protein